MAIINLSTFDKIVILKEAKEACKLNTYKFMCWCIIDAYDEINCARTNNIDSIKLIEQIELFTRENAFKICKQKGLILPTLKAEAVAWWVYNEEKARIAFFDWLIEQYVIKYMDSLPISEIIKVLEIAKNLIIRLEDRNDCYICNNITYAMRDYCINVFGLDISFKYDSLIQFKLFTKHNANIICQKYKLKKPLEVCGAWWDGEVKKPRLAFLNWLIKEYKKQLDEEGQENGTM